MYWPRLRELKNPYFKGITIGFIAGFAGLLFHAIGANTFIIVRIMEPFWFFAGIIVVIPMLEEKALLESEKVLSPDAAHPIKAPP